MSTISSSSLLSSLSSSASSSSGISLSSLLQAATGSSSAGIDVSAAVAAAVYAAQAPERQWQSQQSTLKSQISALSSIQSALSALSADFDDLGDLNGSLSARTATSSNAAVVSATATSGAAIAGHVVSVAALASKASWYSPSLSSANATLGNSTFTLTRADGSVSRIALGNGVNSLTDLVGAINGAGAGVNASVVTDAAGARLALVGTATGSANDFTAGFSAGQVGSWDSASASSATAALPAGVLQVSDGSGAATINIAAGDTLTSIANRVNSQGLGVSASVVADSAGAHLQISSNTGGTVSVTGDPVLSMSRAAAASDASLTVDGIPVTSASNSVQGVVQGVTFNLNGVTSGSPVSVGVAADAGSASNALTAMVKDYNSALSLVSSQFALDSTTGAQGVLNTNSGIRSLQSTLLGMAGYSAGTGSVSSLANLGITMADDGTLSLDSAKLSSALAQPAAVQQFFQGAALNGFASSSAAAVKKFSSPASGTLAQEIQQMNSQYSELQTHVDDYESGYIAAQRNVLTAMYSKAEIALQQLPSQLKQIQAQLGSNSGS